MPFGPMFRLPGKCRFPTRLHRKAQKVLEMLPTHGATWGNRESVWAHRELGFSLVHPAFPMV